MRILLLALAVVIGLAGSTQAQPPPLGPFTEQFAKALQKAMPSAKVTVMRDLLLDIVRADGTSVVVNLGNQYRDYSSSPGWFEDVVKTLAAGLARSPVVHEGGPNRARIVPVIKDRAWLAGLQDRFRSQSATLQPLFEDFNKELVVVYAEDTDRSTRYLASAEVGAEERAGLRALAVKNLMRIMPKIEQRLSKEGGFAMITSHGDYGASLLLVDHIWSGNQIKFEGDTVVAVPAKDVILATGSRNHNGLKVIRLMAAKLAKGSYGIIDTLFVYRGGQFVRFGGN